MSSPGRFSTSAPPSPPYSPRLQSALARLDAFYLSAPDCRGEALKVRHHPRRLTNANKLLDRLSVRMPSHTTLVTGSKGKGTVSSLIAAGLRLAPFALGPVGTFNSPHTHRYTERVRVDNQPVSDDELGDSLHATMDVVSTLEPRTLNWFDVVVASSMKTLSERGVDCAVIEGGIGVRTDATNIFEPQVSVITNVFAEHLDIIGPTTADVAFDKAAAIKGGSRAIVGMPASHGFADIFRNEATCVTPQASVRFVAPQPGDTMFNTNLKIARAALAAAAEVEGLAVPADEADLLSEGAARGALAALPGRQERLKVKVGSSTADVLLDGAHVPESVDAVLKESNVRDGIILLGSNHDKDVASICKLVVPRAKTVVATMAAMPKKDEVDTAGFMFMKASEVGKECVRAGMREQDIIVHDDVREGLETALKLGAQEGKEVTVIGSMVLAGTVRDILHDRIVDEGKVFDVPDKKDAIKDKGVPSLRSAKDEEAAPIEVTA